MLNLACGEAGYNDFGGSVLQTGEIALQIFVTRFRGSGAGFERTFHCCLEMTSLLTVHDVSREIGCSEEGERGHLGLFLVLQVILYGHNDPKSR